jgi:hypothetical protein
MTAPRFTFQEAGYSCWNTYRFYDDRIERDWWTVSLRRGKETYPVGSISGQISEQTTFAYGLKGTLKSLATYIVLALVFRLGFTNVILNRVGLLFCVLAGLSTILAVMKLKKDTWLYVKKIDGSTLFGVREKGVKSISCDDFVREIKRYVKEG